MNKFQNRLLLAFILGFSFLLTETTLAQSECELTTSLFYPTDYAVSAPCLANGKLHVLPKNGTPPYAYQWSNGDTTQIADSLSYNERYNVTVTDAAGCSSTIENILVMLRPNPPSPYVRIINNGPEVYFESAPHGYENIVASYEWTLNGTILPQKNASFTLFFEEPGEHKIKLKITDVCGQVYIGNEQFVFVWISPEDAFTLDIGNIEGNTGDTISMPVSVRNFKDIIGFQKSVHLLTETTGKIIGFSDFNLEGLSLNNFERRADNLWNVAWFTQAPISIPDSTILYTIQVELLATTEECTKITFDGEDIPLQIATSDGNSSPTTIQYPWIRAAETCIATSLSIGGKVTTPTGNPIEGVQIINSVSEELVTNENGDYLLSNLPNNQSYTLSLKKTETNLDNLTSLDLILILRHILNREQLNNPYQLTAANVNNDQQISILDLITLQQFILGKIPSLPSGNWLFLPKSFQFSSTGNVLQTSFPGEITLTDLTKDELDYDFIGIQMGDVSYDINNNLQATAQQRSSENLLISIDNQSFTKNKILNIPLKINDPKDLIGLQLGLQFDTEKLEFIGIEEGSIQKVDYATNQLESGQLPLLWYQEEGTTQAFANLNLMVLQFKTKQTGQLKKALSINNKALPNQAIFDDLSTQNMRLEFEENENENLQNDLSVFDDFPWLSDLVNPDECTDEKITVYQSGAFQYLFVETATDQKLYFQNGTLYCTNAPNFDCVAAYRLTEINQQWLCNAAGVDADEDGTFADADPDDNDPCVPDNTANNCVIDADGDGVSADVDADDTDPCVPDNTSIACDSGELPTIFQDFPFLLDLVNPKSCLDESIEVYQTSVFNYFLVKNTTGEKLYFENGALYCTNSNSYDCVSAYNLGEPISIWTCEPIVEPVDSVVQFFIAESEGKAGETISLPVTVKNFKNLLGFQTAIQLNQLGVVKILGTSNYGISSLGAEDFNIVNDSELTVVWFREDPISVNDETVLFTIEVELLEITEKMCTQFEKNPNGIITEVIGLGYKKMDAALNFEQICVQPSVITNPSVLQFTAETANGQPGQLIQIPIRGNNFTDILSVQKSIRLSHSGVGRIVGVSNFGLPDLTADNFNFINDTLMTLVWFQPTATTLADNSIFYAVDILLMDAENEDCVDLIIDDTRTPIEVADKDLNVLDYEIVTGEICIEFAASAAVFISGYITTEMGEPLAEVLVNCTNETPTQPDDFGFYHFSELSAGQSYEITPQSSGQYLEDVSTLDLVYIMKHILDKERLDSPYKLLAADVNQDGKITARDLVLTRQVILDIKDGFPNDKSWLFIPKTFEMSMNAMPTIAEVPQSITIPNADGRYINQDFIGIKLGNVSYDLEDNLGNSPSATARNNPTPYLFQLDNVHFEKGDLIEVAIRADDFNKVLGYQMELGFDIDILKLVNIEKSLAQKEDLVINDKKSAVGILPMVYVQNTELENSDKTQTTIILNLQFRTLKAGNLEENISINRQNLQAELVNQNKIVQDIQLVFKQSISPNYDEVKLYPNPATNQAWLSIQSIDNQNITIRLLDVNGKTHFQQDYNLVKGHQRLSLPLDNLVNGVYYLSIAGADSRLRTMEKLVVLRP